MIHADKPRDPTPDRPEDRRADERASPDLASLGLEEVERRLETSPLLTTTGADAPGSMEREGTSCSCKINDDPPEREEDDGDEDG